MLERVAILSEGDRIEAADLEIRRAGSDGGEAATLSDLEREAIRRTLAEVGGNRKEAAERLGIGVRTLYEKLKRYEQEGP